MCFIVIVLLMHYITHIMEEMGGKSQTCSAAGNMLTEWLCGSVGQSVPAILIEISWQI